MIVRLDNRCCSSLRRTAGFLLVEKIFSLHLRLALARVHKDVEKSVPISRLQLRQVVISTLMCWNQFVVINYLVQLKLRGEPPGHGIYQNVHITAVEREWRKWWGNTLCSDPYSPVERGPADTEESIQLP